ncbi:MAG: hypothetical protein J5804_02700 [Eggerthellaceae bacterium]|nr:hypothetical protein [Eggerthellaceae bacterium]
MTILDRNDKHLDLACDFPARETFRKSLLNRLKTNIADGSPIDKPAQTEPRNVRLDDDDLDMLAAAQGDLKPPK